MLSQKNSIGGGFPDGIKTKYSDFTLISKTPYHSVYKAHLKEDPEKKYLIRILDVSNPSYSFSHYATLFLREILYICTRVGNMEALKIEDFELDEKNIAFVMKELYPLNPDTELELRPAVDIKKLLKDVAIDLEFLKNTMKFDDVKIDPKALFMENRTKTYFLSDWAAMAPLPIMSVICNNGTFTSSSLSEELLQLALIAFREKKVPSSEIPQNNLSRESEKDAGQAILQMKSVLLNYFGDSKPLQKILVKLLQKEVRSVEEFCNLVRESFKAPVELDGEDLSLTQLFYPEVNVEKKDTNRAFIMSGDVIVYQGFVNKNQKNGKGRFLYPNGDIYQGQWENDKRNGEGKLFFKRGGTNEFEGGYYEGGFVNDQMDNIGELHSKTRILYDGEFRANLRHGHGKLYDEQGKFSLVEYFQGVKKETLSEWGGKPNIQILKIMPASTSKPVLRKQYGIEITPDDFKTLTDEKLHLSDNIVNYYMRALENKLLEFTFESDSPQQRVFFFDSDFMTLLSGNISKGEGTNNQAVEKYLRGYNAAEGHLIFHEFDRILLVTKSTQNHDTLAEIRCEKDDTNSYPQKIDFYIYNPCGSDDESGQYDPKSPGISLHLYNFVENEIKKSKVKKNELSLALANSRLNIEKIPKAKSPELSGIYICRYAQCIAAGRDRDNIELKDPEEFREEIKNVIMGIYQNPLFLNRLEKLQIQGY